MVLSLRFCQIPIIILILRLITGGDEIVFFKISLKTNNFQLTFGTSLISAFL